MGYLYNVFNAAHNVMYDSSKTFKQSYKTLQSLT